LAQSVLTQEELIERAGRGDEAAFEALYRETAPRLFAIALRMTGQHAAAEDVLHEAYVAVWRSAARFDPRRGSARAWLGTILRRKAIDRLRASPWLERAIDAEALPAPAAAVVERSDEAALSLRQCLERLAPESFRAIWLCALYGFSYRELSDRLSEPVPTLKSRVRRGLLALRKCLDG